MAKENPRSASPGPWRQFWEADFSPLDGRQRGVVVLVLVALALREFPTTLAAQLTACPSELYEPSGLMRWLVPAGEGARDWGAFSANWFPLVAALLAMGALGFGGRLPFFLGVGLLTILWGASRGCVGTGHSWYLPLYTLLILSLLAPVDRWSVDAWLARRLLRRLSARAVE